MGLFLISCKFVYKANTNTDTNTNTDKNTNTDTNTNTEIKCMTQDSEADPICGQPRLFCDGLRIHLHDLCCLLYCRRGRNEK